MTTTSPSNLPTICSALLAAKAHSGKTFADLAEVMGRDEVFVAAIFYGQAKPTSEDLDKLSSALGGNTAHLNEDALRDPVSGLGDNYFPTRGGAWEMPPKDPLLYRLYEILVVYGLPLKHIIHEKTGQDGIVSAINFKAHVDVKDDPEGKRVVITLDGKWLPYVQW